MKLRTEFPNTGNGEFMKAKLIDMCIKHFNYSIADIESYDELTNEEKEFISESDFKYFTESIKKTKKDGGVISPKYDLVGIDGNAYSIMGYVSKCMRKEKKSEEEIKAYTDEAKSGEYNKLLYVSIDMIDKLNIG